MRFLFFDRVAKIEKGKAIEASKTFSLAEEFHSKHFTKIPLIPGVIFIESMAQVLGWLINYTHDFKLLAIMSLLDGVKVPARLRAGFKARVRAEIISASSTDSIGRAWVDTQEGEVIASIDRIIYTHLQNVDPGELLKWFRYCSGSEDPTRE